MSKHIYYPQSLSSGKYYCNRHCHYCSYINTYLYASNATTWDSHNGQKFKTSPFLAIASFFIWCAPFVLPFYVLHVRSGEEKKMHSGDSRTIASKLPKKFATTPTVYTIYIQETRVVGQVKQIPALSLLVCVDVWKSRCCKGIEKNFFFYLSLGRWILFEGTKGQKK